MTVDKPSRVLALRGFGGFRTTAGPFIKTPDRLINALRQPDFMQIQIPKDVDKKINEVSKVFGIGKEEIIDRAILLYLDSIQKQLELKKELKSWDLLSDEALENFERDLPQ